MGRRVLRPTFLRDARLMTPTLETARLLMRPTELADAEQIQAIFPQWEITAEEWRARKTIERRYF
jgi:hypothetical protein